MTDTFSPTHAADMVALFESRQVPADAPTPSPAGGGTPIDHLKIRHEPGALRVNADGTATISGPSVMNTADLRGDGSQGILSTGRSLTGSPRAAADLRPTDIIMIEGREWSVQVAERCGYLDRDEAGKYHEATPQEAPKAEVQADLGEAFEDKAAETRLSSICNGVSPSVQVSVLRQLTEGGTVNAETLSRAASEMKVDPGAMQGAINSVVQAFEAQAAKAVRTVGIEDADAFFDWARATQGAKFRAAMQRQGMERSTAGYTELAREYHAGIADRDPQAVLNATFGGGIKAHQAHDGKVILTIPGRGQLEYRAALRAGLIDVAGA